MEGRCIIEIWPKKIQLCRPLKTYVDLLSEDTGLSGRDLETTTLERCHWRNTIFCDPSTTH